MKTLVASVFSQKGEGENCLSEFVARFAVNNFMRNQERQLVRSDFSRTS